MKITLPLILGLLLFQLGISFAADNTCEKNFGQDVAYCAQTLNDTQFSSPKEKGEWQKACVDQAKINKMVCEQGGPGPTCAQQCQITYDSTALTCQQQYDYAIQTCAIGDQFCIQFYNQFLANCLAAALNTLYSCVAACPVQ